MSDDFLRELRGWEEIPGRKVSDDVRRMMWLMRKAADEIEALRKQLSDAELTIDGLRGDMMDGW